MSKSRFTLSEGEQMTPLYIKLKKHLEARLDEHRQKNDRSLNAEETAHVRGQIEELKHLLRAGLESRES